MQGLRRLVTIATVASVLTVTGCELPTVPQSSAPASRDAAVIDLDAVAKALGRDIVLRDQLTSANQQLTTKLSELAAGLRSQIEEEKKKLGEAPSKEAQQEFQKVGAQAQLQLRRGQSLARQRAQQYQAQLVSQFRTEVLPIARKIAIERGTPLVLVKSNVLWHDPSTDITQAVIVAMQGMAPAAPAPAQPQSGG